MFKREILNMAELDLRVAEITKENDVAAVLVVEACDMVGLPIQENRDWTIDSLQKDAKRIREELEIVYGDIGVG